MTSNKKRVLIADYKNWDSLMEIPYLFELAGCTVDAYSCKGSWLSRSKYIKNIFHATEDPNTYIKKLEDLAQKGNYDWIVLGDDYAVRLIAQLSKNEHVAKKLFPISNLNNRHILGSKAGFSVACSQYEILTPIYEIYTDNKDLLSISNKISFPLLLKIDESAGGAGVFLCNTLPEIYNYLETLNKKEKHNLVLQKYISGENIAVETIYKNGKLLMYSYCKVVKTLSSEFGISVERIYCQYSQIEETLKRIGKSFSIHGFCSMTFIRNEQGHYLVETDFRPQGWYVTARLIGIDFYKGIAAFFEDDPVLLPLPFPHKTKEVTIRHFLRSISWNLKNKNYTDLFALCLNKDGVWHTLPTHDPKLLSYIFLKKLQSVFNKTKKLYTPYFNIKSSLPAPTETIEIGTPT